MTYFANATVIDAQQGAVAGDIRGGRIDILGY
jgi:hypothetical protein